MGRNNKYTVGDEVVFKGDLFKITDIKFVQLPSRVKIYYQINNFPNWYGEEFFESPKKENKMETMDKFGAFKALCEGKRVGFGDCGHYLEISGNLIYFHNTEMGFSNPSGHINLISGDEFYLVPKSGYEEIKEILPEITRICSGTFDDFEEGLASINAMASQIEQICKRELEKNNE